MTNHSNINQLHRQYHILTSALTGSKLTNQDHSDMSSKKSRYRPEHMRMLNDKRWRETKRIVWQRAKGLCEWCIRDGKAAGVPEGWIRAGVDCHHLIPFESAKTIAEAERLCYSADNCVLLCIEHHVKAHKELQSKSKAKVKERREQAFERWKDAMSNR